LIGRQQTPRHRVGVGRSRPEGRRALVDTRRAIFSASIADAHTERVNYYWIYPWPIRIVNEESVWTWLGPVLAFLGSVLLFAGSLYVMSRTNRAADHRAAQDRRNERERDYRLFQRDKLLSIGDDIVEAAIETWDEFRNLRNSPDPLSGEPFQDIDAWGRKIAANVVRLRLIGTHDVSERCIELRDAIGNQELRKTILELDVAERDTVRAQLHCREPERLTRVDQLKTSFTELMGRINDARQAFSDSVERELARTGTSRRRLEGLTA
jgi:hypothetical protein